MKSILNLARPEIVAMTPYSSARREQNTGRIWLNANENPWSDNEAEWNRYPDPQPNELLQRLSKIYQIETDHLLVGRGSDEAIDLLIRVFCIAAKDAILICPPTYGMYKIAAQIQNAAIVEVPLIKEKGFSLDVDKILTSWQPNIKLIFLCNPNNPTGNLLNSGEILYLAERLQEKALIVVDEAYIEFSNQESLIDSVKQFPNLVILRTLSKAYGLAGVRCGVAIANPIVIKLLLQVIAPYPIPKPIAQLLCQHLSDEELAQVPKRIALLNQQREQLMQFLKKLSFVKQIWPSQANFLLMEVNDAQAIMQHCQNHGIIIRDRSQNLGLNNCIRISMGTPDENQYLMEVLQHVQA